MKFLSVFCVVLYLRSGVSAHAHNNENAQYYNNFDAQRDGSVQSNIAPNSAINWQIQTEEKERNRPINSRQFNSRGDSRRESLNNSPEYDNLQRKIPLNEASIGSNYMGQQQGFHQDHILPSNVNSYQDVRGNGNRVNDQGVNRRENILQGFSSEYVRQQPIQNMNIQPLRAQEYDSSSMLNHARLINKQNRINEPHFISRDISRLPLNLRDFSSDQPQLVQNMNELPFNKQENILPVLPDSRYKNALPIMQTNEPLLKAREYIKYQPIQNTKTWEIKPEDRNSMITDSNTFINSKSIINQPILKQEEETKLELEGISPEYIESLINRKVHEPLSSTRSLQNSYQHINTPLEVPEELNNNQYNIRNQQMDKISTFQNPSAEILYKMQKALPYETELPSPGDNNMKSIVNNLKRGQEFYTLPSPNKRYMVIHPNGNVEYVDQIAKIIENHPNYVMVTSADYLKRLEDRSKMHSVPFVPQIEQNLPVSTIQAAAIKQEYNEENHNLPEIKLAQAYSSTKMPAPYLDSSLVTSTETPSITATETDTFQKSPLASLIVNTVATTSPQQTIEQDNISNLGIQNIIVSSTLTPIETSTENTKNKSDDGKTSITKQINNIETVITESISETDRFEKSPLTPVVVNIPETNVLQQGIEQNYVLNLDSQNITVSSTLTPVKTSTENTKNTSDKDTIDKKLITKPIPNSETNKTLKTDFVSDTDKFEKTSLDPFIVNFAATNISQQKIAQDNMSNPDSQNITISSILTLREKSTENTKNKSDDDIIDMKLITNPIPYLEINKTVITESVSDTDKFKKNSSAPFITASNISQQKIEQDNISNPDSQNITVSSILTPIETSTGNTNNKSDDYIIDKKLSNPILDFETNEIEISENTTQPQNTMLAQFNGEELYSTEILPTNHEVLPNNSSENISTATEYISEETSTEKQVTTTPVPVSYETKISNVSKSDCHNDTEVTSSSADKTYPEPTSFSQNETADNSTGFWFEADNDFWENIMTRNETQNQFYFFFVPPKPSVEKETKTTVFANGTTIEEVIETVTKDGEAKILKTTKITHANCTSTIV